MPRRSRLYPGRPIGQLSSSRTGEARLGLTWAAKLAYLRQVAAGCDRTLELSCPLNQEARVAWTVKATDEYAAWFTALIKQDLDSATQVAQAVAALREEGPTLGRPLVDRLKATKIHHLKELRPGSRDGRRSGSSLPSTPPGQRCCSWAAIRRATGHAGTATTSR